MKCLNRLLDKSKDLVKTYLTFFSPLFLFTREGILVNFLKCQLCDLKPAVSLLYYPHCQVSSNQSVTDFFWVSNSELPDSWECGYDGAIKFFPVRRLLKTMYEISSRRNITLPLRHAEGKNDVRNNSRYTVAPSQQRNLR